MCHLTGWQQTEKDRNMEVTLNRLELAILANLDATTRPIVEKQLLKNKEAKLKLQAEKQGKWIKARTEFSIRLGDLGNVIITGLGKRFPFSPYPGELEALKSHMAEIDKFIIENKAELDKRYQTRKTVIKARKIAARENNHAGNLSMVG